MFDTEKTTAIKQLIDEAQHIVVIQADNPDGDSLGSALALEELLGNQDKTVTLYCGVDVPGYLRYLNGWDRVVNELPKSFDLSIVVDASTTTLLGKLEEQNQLGWLAAKPCIVLDHHGEVLNPISFARITINEPSCSSAGELVYSLAKSLGWPVTIPAGTAVMTAILGDTQGLSNSLATPQTYKVMAELVEAGVERPKLEEARREFSKMPEVIFRYKATLMQRAELHADNRIVCVTITNEEIINYSPLYNPAPLVQFDMLQINDVEVAIVFKHYADGKVTAAIRCNPTASIGAELAEHFGGGGHPFASGFKVTSGRPYNEIKSECLRFATELLDKLKQGTSDETLQHTHPAA